MYMIDAVLLILLLFPPSVVLTVATVSVFPATAFFAQEQEDATKNETDDD